MKVKFEKVNNGLIPEYKTEGSAGADCCSNENVTLPAGKRVLVHLGFKTEFSNKYEAQIRPRSGMALKHGITVLNSPGTIDADYRGEWGVILLNTSDKTFKIKKGDRICQVVFSKIEKASFSEKKINKTNRKGGFGSTGK